MFHNVFLCKQGHYTKHFHSLSNKDTPKKLYIIVFYYNENLRALTDKKIFKILYDNKIKLPICY